MDAVMMCVVLGTVVIAVVVTCGAVVMALRHWWIERFKSM